MFWNCESLKNVNILKKWKFAKKNYYDSMFG